MYLMVIYSRKLDVVVNYLYFITLNVKRWFCYVWAVKQFTTYLDVLQYTSNTVTLEVAAHQT